MNLLALKLILAPVIIGSASLAGRKWGSAVSGWLIGLPLTSGPVIFLLSFDHDVAFVNSSILGTLSGGFPLVMFCLAYAWLATRFRWQVVLTGSLLAFGTMTVLMQNIIIPLVPLFIAVVLAIIFSIQVMPGQGKPVSAETEPGGWDIPVRILIGTGFILLLTEIASFIGPRLTGLLTTIPLYTIILTVFAHRLQGAHGAISVLRGLQFGLFAFASFYLTLGILVERSGIGTAFIVAIVVALALQGSTLWILPQK